MMNMKQKYFLILGIIVVLGIIFISGCIQKGLEEAKATGEDTEAYEGFNLKLGETKEFSLSEHKISVVYLSNSPKQLLEVIIDGERDIIEIEITDICYITTTKCETIVPEDESGEKKTVCKEIQERSDCRYFWRKGEIIFYVNPLIIEQDLDKDGKICEDPFEIDGKPMWCGTRSVTHGEGLQIDNDGDGLVNEDYQEYYYYRDSWDTDLLEFSVGIQEEPVFATRSRRS